MFSPANLSLFMVLSNTTVSVCVCVSVYICLCFVCTCIVYWRDRIISTFVSLQAFLFIHEVWIVPVFLPVFTYLLWRELGPSCLVAIVLIMLLPPIQYIFVRMYTKLK